ncbi:formyltransferase family protein [Saprospira sp. CCB-QB6]|uniref:formyltransferase family protein n=1 Tax=Saprospira sp. CCB-QB6 TaxID=3023936 RepID=UPI00234A1139|nr:formyltransferase family protein [Saprospira sp. CCB-QB6]WCL82600.1 formyltransferase family protein [Saprospira sp. CCB-QB6]
MKTRRYVFLVSGGGGNLRVLAQLLALGLLEGELVGVLADRACPALSWAQQKGIFAQQISYRQSQAEDLRWHLAQLQADLIITNIHKIIDAQTLAQFAQAHWVNLHYSLLPAFAGLIGLAPLKAAKKQNLPFFGASAHLVEAQVDAGPILAQGIFATDWEKKSEKAHIEQTFRAGALALWAALAQLEGQNLMEAAEDVYWENGQSIRLHPAPKIPEQLRQEAFWQSI